MIPEFISWPKIARLNRQIIITCKLDGTCSQVCITPEGEIFAGSRTRWITPADDNYGFAGWVERNKEELLKLGPGRHYGEYWGNGIQRGYGEDSKHFSLFNTTRWENSPDLPSCCRVVPVLYRGLFDQAAIIGALDRLREGGSVAAPGFMKPEGIVVYHMAASTAFKVTLEKDEQHKGKNQ